MRKVKNDVRDLALVAAKRRRVCVTEPELGLWIERQKQRMNFPADLEVITATIPSKLRRALTLAQRESSREILE